MLVSASGAHFIRDVPRESRYWKQDRMAKSGMRSSALARAQAQLAGQRVPLKPKDASDELQEYMHALNKKTNALKFSQPSVIDLSDLSVEEQESEKYAATIHPQQVSGTQSRFLKKKTSSSSDVKSDVVTIEAKRPVLPQPVQSKLPTSAALRRLAEIENRHRLRKLDIDISENDSDLKTSEERIFSNRSSSEFSTQDKRFLKKKVNIMEPEPARPSNGHAFGNQTAKSNQKTMESEEEEMLHLIGSSVEFSENDERWWKLPKPPRTPSPPSKSTPRRKLHHSPSALGFASPRRLPSRTPSPPSYGSSRFPRRTPSLSRFKSRSPSPSVRSSLNSPSPRTRRGRLSRTPVSQRSDMKSLDELFSRPDDLSSASSNDFKLNILSLDDLALPVEAEEDKGKMISEKPKEHPISGPDNGHIPSRGAKSFTRHSISEEESVLEAITKNKKESLYGRVSSSSSSEHYTPATSDESTVNSVYSEDFEESVFTNTKRSSKSESYSYSESMSAKKSVLSSSPSVIPSNKERHRRKAAGNIQRVTVKEIAVQTNVDQFNSLWPHASIGINHPTAHFMDPVSMVSHLVSPDLIEALTTYSPMALALNDMLKQQLFLTRSFVDMAQQLYLSTVKSLENESYCYTTLENTKAVIRR